MSMPERVRSEVLRVAPVAVASLLIGALVVLVVGQRAVASAASAPPTAVSSAGPVRTARLAPGRCAKQRWVAAWTAPAQDTTSNTPARPGWAPGATGQPDPDGPGAPARSVLRDQTLRMIVTPHASGSSARVRFGNRFGREPLRLVDIRLALRAAGADLVPGSERPVTFAGRREVTVAPGTTVTSDPVPLPIPAFADLAVSFHVPGPASLDVHLDAFSDQYATPAGTGDHAGDGTGAAYSERLTSWLALTGVDVMARTPTGAVVALGDSLTDGIGSSLGGQGRWTDSLARRFAATGAPLSVVNAGISGNQVAAAGELSGSHSAGPAAAVRVGPDALDLAGVTDLVVLAGINDLYAAREGEDVVARVEAGYQRIADAARAAGVRVIGATLTPGALPPEKEAQRQRLNDWIRAGGAFDRVVDFDAAVRDPGDPSRVDRRYVADIVHLTDAGYARLADAIPAAVFQGARCIAGRP